jgi:hypothetical protein
MPTKIALKTLPKPEGCQLDTSYPASMFARDSVRPLSMHDPCALSLARTIARLYPIPKHARNVLYVFWGMVLVVRLR